MRFSFLLLVAGPLPCFSQFPQLLWSSNLLKNSGISGGGLRKGNGIVLSSDQRKLWVTDAAGSLHLVRLLDEERQQVAFTPDSLPNRMVESRSSASLFEGSTHSFAVYTVIDAPNVGDGSIESRVICVDGNNSLMWTTSVAGSAVGNPQISSDGKSIVVLHNVPKGMVTILDVQEDGNILAQLPGNFLSPFGPPVLVTIDGVDIMYWGESTHNGYADAGRTFHMKLEEPFNVVADFLFDSSTVVQPTVSSDGTMMWLGGKEASIYSWKLTGNEGRIWKQQLALSRRNVTFPVVNAIEASGSKLFVSSASNSFHCLDANQGNILWSASLGPSIYLSSAKASPRDNVVYSIQHLTGKVVQQDAGTGDVLWHFDCINITSSETCMDSVEAESSLSQDGSILYYGDIYGTVYALGVSHVPPTTAPTQQPSFEPSEMTSSTPTAVQSQDPSSRPSLKDSQAPSDDPSFLPAAMTDFQSDSSKDKTPGVAPTSPKSGTAPAAEGSTSGAANVCISSMVVVLAVIFV